MLFSKKKKPTVTFPAFRIIPNLNELLIKVHRGEASELLKHFKILAWMNVVGAAAFIGVLFQQEIFNFNAFDTCAKFFVLSKFSSLNFSDVN